MSVNSVHVNDEYNLSPPSKYYIAATPRVSIELRNTTRNAGLIDTKAEINIITLDLARRTGFPIRDGPRFINIIFQIGHSREFYKVIKKMSVKIGSIVNTILI